MADEFLIFVDERRRKEWEEGSLDPLLKEIVREAAGFVMRMAGAPITITSIWRTQGEDRNLGGTGIHYAWRGVDVRTRDLEPLVVSALTSYLNGKYVYDPSRPLKVVAYGKPHGDGPHLHLQSFPGRTTLRQTPRET